MKLQTIITAAAMLATANIAAAKEPILYTSNPVQTIEAVNAEAQKVIGTQLGVITGGGGVLMRRLEAEKDAPQGDVFWSASAGTLGAYKELFEAYSSPELAAIPEKFRYPGDLFQPTNIHVVTLMVNTSLLDGAPVPKTWAELADPAWNGKIIVANPNNSSMGYTVAWGLAKSLDEKTYKAIASNVVVTESSSGVQKAVAMGEYAIGIGFEWNAYNYIAGGQEELEVVYPDEGTFLSTEYAGLVKNAPAGDTAKKAIDVLLSKDAQIELLKVGFRRPSRSDINVTDHVQMPALETIKTLPIDELAAADAREGFLKEWDALPKAGESE